MLWEHWTKKSTWCIFCVSPACVGNTQYADSVITLIDDLQFLLNTLRKPSCQNELWRVISISTGYIVKSFFYRYSLTVGRSLHISKIEYKKFIRIIRRIWIPVVVNLTPMFVTNFVQIFPTKLSCCLWSEEKAYPISWINPRINMDLALCSGHPKISTLISWARSATYLIWSRRLLEIPINWESFESVIWYLSYRRFSSCWTFSLMTREFVLAFSVSYSTGLLLLMQEVFSLD